MEWNGDGVGDGDGDGDGGGCGFGRLCLDLVRSLYTVQVDRWKVSRFLDLSSERSTSHGSHRRVFSESYDAARVGKVFVSVSYSHDCRRM